MPLRNARAFTFRPLGVTDAVDTSNAPKGAMVALQNLVPDPSNSGLFVCRPAGTLMTLFTNWQAINQVSAFLVVGDWLYGMVASALYDGFDEPFCYNLASGGFVTVLGVTATNLPKSQPTTGDWIPPSIAQVGTRIVVAHSGFDTTKGNYIGWFDVGGANVTTTANIYNGSLTLDGNPSVLGVQPGMSAFSPDGYFPNSYVTKTTQYVNATYGTTNGTTSLTAVANTVGIVPGNTIAGAGIQTGTTVVSIVGATVTMSLAAVASATLGAVTFSGATVNISQDATASHNGATVEFVGGDVGAPLWGAGNVDRNPLEHKPTSVAQLNGRAYYASIDDTNIPFSDSGLACRATDSLATQVLATQNGIGVSALAPLMLNAPLLTAGVAQALIVFGANAACMWQIRGDPTTEDLTINLLPVATGTISPNSVCACEAGTVFVTPNEGVRIVKFDGTVSEPIGQGGAGVVQPFINTTYKSRIAAACNGGVIRFTVNTGPLGATMQEYWYDVKRRIWTGPHTLPAQMIQPWRHTFVLVPTTQTALMQSDAVPSAASTYVEGSGVLGWSYQLLMPDSGDNQMQHVVDMTIGLQLPWLGNAVLMQASDMDGEGLSYCNVPAPASTDEWGVAVWGEGHWAGTGNLYQQYSVDWDQPLNFKQLRLTASGQSSAGVRIGNIEGKMQPAGYKLEAA